MRNDTILIQVSDVQLTTNTTESFYRQFRIIDYNKNSFENKMREYESTQTI